MKTKVKIQAAGILPKKGADALIMFCSLRVDKAYHIRYNTLILGNLDILGISIANLIFKQKILAIERKKIEIKRLSD